MALKLPKPPPDDGTRAEFSAFMWGFALALAGVKKSYPNFETDDIMKSAVETAIELYPPFDPPTEPVKCLGDGRRSDGIEMSED
jgi:hypothetical protein